MPGIQQYRIAKRNSFSIEAFSPEDTGCVEDRQQAEQAMAENLAKINELQQKLYAEKREGVIFLFQAMDAAGKDGTIRAVLSCLSPQGVTESAFKAPSSTELAHDFLWRIARCVPEKGQIAIFNRSHYEDVLVGRVHKLYEHQAHARRVDPDSILADRYHDIRNWEEYLYHNSIRMVKIFLNVSKEEQARRFLSRIESPEKNWKFNAGDMEERRYWAEYQQAFSDAVNETATPECPWYIVPADHKWYMRYVVSQIIADTLEEMDPQWPEMSAREREALQEYIPQLRREDKRSSDKK
jgi:PPK2 family polyphosphate:nucleotide phosphotransferase